MTTCKLSFSSRRWSIWTDNRCDWIFTCWMLTHIFSRFVRLTLWCVSGSDWKQDDTREAAGGRRQAQEGGSHAHCMLTHLAFYSLILSMYKTWTLSYPEESVFSSQVNMWAFHDPYALIGEDKPFKSGEPNTSRVSVYVCRSPGVSVGVCRTPGCLSNSQLLLFFR